SASCDSRMWCGGFMSAPEIRNARQRCDGPTSGLLGKRYELVLITRHDVEVTSLPLGLSLLDAFLARRNEIPPDIAGTVHRGTANQPDARVTGWSDGDRIAGPKHEKLVRREAITRNVDLA